MTEEKNKNLEFWNKVEKTKDRNNTTKKVEQRGGFTAIDAMAQSKIATSHFGSYGVGWGLKNIIIEYLDLITGAEKTQKIAVLKATFYTTIGEVETSNSIEVQSASGRFDSDFMKKLITNTLSKELSRLGFNADIFMGKFEDSEYLSELDKLDKLPSEILRVSKEIKKIKDTNELGEYWKNNSSLGEEVSKLITERAEEIKKIKK